MEHGNHSGMGQNLAYKSGGEFTAQEAADIWYNEVQNYNFSSPGFAANTGHFTQLVWKGTTQVGIGKAVRGNTTFVVANYLPPGNVAGQYLSERPYSLDADKEWKMSIHQKSSQLFITMRGKYGAEDR
eukprot:Em0010g232a